MANETFYWDGLTRLLEDNRPFATTGHMAQNPPYWIAKECDKTPLGNVNKEKSHFCCYLCIILKVGTFFCNPVWQIYTMLPVVAKGLFRGGSMNFGMGELVS